MLPLLFLPAAARGLASVVFLYLTFGSLGFRLGQARYEDIFGLVGMKPRASAAAARGDVHVIDTSALIDGRVADLVATGFMSGTMLLHDGVLRELQAITDSSDPTVGDARPARPRHTGGAPEGAHGAVRSSWRKPA